MPNHGIHVCKNAQANVSAMLSGMSIASCHSVKWSIHVKMQPMGWRQWTYKINVKLVKRGVWFNEGCKMVAMNFGALATNVTIRSRQDEV